MDATSGDLNVQQQGSEKLRFCISALQDMEAAWSWSFRARRALQILAAAWLTKAPGSLLSTSSGKAQQESAVLTGSAAAQIPCGDTSLHSHAPRGAGADAMPHESPTTLSDFERQFNDTSLPALSANNLDLIFNVDNLVDGRLDDPNDWQSWTETDRWLTMAAQSTFAPNDMESYPY